MKKLHEGHLYMLQERKETHHVKGEGEEGPGSESLIFNKKGEGRAQGLRPRGETSVLLNVMRKKAVRNLRGGGGREVPNMISTGSKTRGGGWGLPALHEALITSSEIRGERNTRSPDEEKGRSHGII